MFVLFGAFLGMTLGASLFALALRGVFGGKVGDIADAIAGIEYAE